MIDRFIDFIKGKKKEKVVKTPQFDNKELMEEAESLLSYALDPVSARLKSTGRPISVRLIELTTYVDSYEDVYYIVLVATRNEVDIKRVKADIISYIEYADAKYGVDFDKSKLKCHWISKGNPDNFKDISLKDIYDYNGRFQAISIAVKKFRE